MAQVEQKNKGFKQKYFLPKSFFLCYSIYKYTFQNILRYLRNSTTEKACTQVSPVTVQQGDPVANRCISLFHKLTLTWKDNIKKKTCFEE